jgi:hypothetical protein
MSRLDRRFAELREQALRQPMTRANQGVLPEVLLPEGVALGLTVNL